MKFDVVFGNPPFQKTDTRKKTQHKLWIDFTLKAVNEWLVDGGHLSWITPTSWSSPSNKVLRLFKDNDVKSINLDTKKYFPDIGSTFSNYHIVKGNNSITTSLTKDGNKFNFCFDDTLMYVPTDVCGDSLSIHKKVMFDTTDKLDVRYDYVTCHNVIRHALKINQERLDKKLDSLKKCKSVNEATKAFETIKTLITNKKTIRITVSKEKTKQHKYPLLHTNNQIWYSSIKQPFHDKPKVMWSRSGYTKPFFDNGELGCTDMGYYILVDNKAAGENLAHNINLDLFKYILKTAKWSGFGNELVFTNLPVIPTDKKMTNADMYKYFSITKSEIEHIDSILSPSKSKHKKDRTSEIKSIERVKNIGEVYTPKELILEMLDEIPNHVWRDKTKNFIDPASGHGNFIVEIVNRKLDSGLSPVEAVSTTFGIDIMKDNVDESHNRVLQLLTNRKVKFKKSEIVNLMKERIVLNNSLTTTMDNIFTEVS